MSTSPNGLEEQAEAELLLYPNPTKRSVRFSSADDTEKTVRIFSSRGQFLEEFTFYRSYQKDLSAYALGSYYYQLVGQGTFQYGVIVKVN